MASHDLKIRIPSKDLYGKDVEIDIRSNGRRLGTLHISKGTLDWTPANAHRATKVGWESFAKLMDLRTRVPARTAGRVNLTALHEHFGITPAVATRKRPAAPARATNLSKRSSPGA